MNANIKYRRVRKRQFIKVRDKLPSEWHVFVTPYAEEQYRRMGAITYLSSTEKSGYAIDAEHNLISLFSLPGALEGEAAGWDAIARGATQLDCIGKRLAKAYESMFGFVVYRMEKWDDQCAPKGWDYKKNGRPNIYYLKLPPRIDVDKRNQV